MTEYRYLELMRLARMRLRCMRSARSAAFRAHMYRDGFARDHASAITREQVALARLYHRRLLAGVRKWNADAADAYTESGAIVCKLSPRLVATTVTP